MTISLLNMGRRSTFAAFALIALSASCSNASEPEAKSIATTTDAHIEAISTAPIATLALQYADEARLDWIGGPLDGAYEGDEAIAEVWARFITVRGEMHAEVQNYLVAENPKGRTIIASIVFRGSKTIPVRLVTTYRDGKIASEIWQIDPALMK